MKKILNPFLFIILTAAIFACSSQKSSEEKVPEAVETKPIERKSADNLDSLNSILLQALANKDKQLYMSYCFTEKQEDKISQILTDSKKKKIFQREFGFSLHEEVAYFENILNYIQKTGIDLTKIDKSLIETIEYNRSNYSPIVLKEVIIPIIQEGIERDIVYVAIQVDEKWYFTSELSL